MKKKHMMLMLLAIFVTLALLPSMAFSWGSATHAYIDDHLNKNSGLKKELNVNEIYGGMAPDIFNYMFKYPAYIGYLYYQTHNEFLRVWDEARSRQEKALAYGFVSHNDMWGADFTAHHSGRTFGQDEGYIIAKAHLLKAKLEQIPEYNALQLPDDIALEIAHSIVEAGADVLVKRMDSFIGQKIISSALLRSPKLPSILVKVRDIDFSDLLVKAYNKDFSEYAGISYREADNLITSAELEFRKTMILYGYALTQDETTAIQLISEQMTELAKSYFAAYGITLPEGVDLTPLIKFATEQSMEMCAGDFDGEVAATINFVDQQLTAHGISY